MVRWGGGRFLVFFKCAGLKISLLFHLVSAVKQGTKRRDGFKIFLPGPRDGNTLPTPPAFTHYPTQP